MEGKILIRKMWHQVVPFFNIYESTSKSFKKHVTFKEGSGKLLMKY